MSARASTFSIRHLSLGKKLTIAISVFVFPVMLMGYFLYVEKDDLISFTQQEIVGVHYLRRAQAVLEAISSPESSSSAIDAAIDQFKKAGQADADALALGPAARDLTAAAAGKDSDAALKQALVLISAASDNSNITLDPDSDAYFVGDIIVNQAPTILAQTGTLIGAARDLDKEKTDDSMLAYGEARDGIASAADNLAADFAKAVNGNGDGTVKGTLSDAATSVRDSVAKLGAAAKSQD